MKIIQQNEQILWLGYPTKIYLGRLLLFLFATPFFCGGIWIILSIGKLNTLKCYRLVNTNNKNYENSVINCELIRESLGNKETINIKQLYGTELGISEGDEGDTYRVEILTDEGNIPLTQVYSSGRKGKIERIQKINNFINNQTINSLVIKQDDRIFAYSFGGIFTLVGSGLIIGSLTFMRQISCIFDKSKNKCFLREDNLFKSQIKEYYLGEIKKVAWEQEKDSDGDLVWRVKIYSHRGNTINLNLSGKLEEKEKIVKIINQFLKN